MFAGRIHGFTPTHTNRNNMFKHSITARLAAAAMLTFSASPACAKEHGKGKKTDDGKLIALDVKEGDKVLFSKYAGTEVKIDGEEYLIMREDDILGIVE